MHVLFAVHKLMNPSRTYQEMVLSRRMLVFTAEEAFFYCPRGMLSESICVGDEPLKPVYYTGAQNVRLCGFLHRSMQRLVAKMGTDCSSLSHSVAQYNWIFMSSLKAYFTRILSHDSDMLNAFSGVINATSCALGSFHWGLPTKMFARALLMEDIYPVALLSQRHEFPSWSWLSWKLDHRAYVFIHAGLLELYF